MSETAPFFRPGGTMDPHALSYIERACDSRLFQALLRREFVSLLDSRQKGKSSMVARTILKLKAEGVATVKLDLQRIGANVTADQWYAGLLAEVGKELGFEAELFEYWGAKRELGPLARWIGALQEVVLAKSEAPIVIFIDEVDFVRALPFPSDEFFAGIRDCYNRRSERKGFGRLTFCLVGVATPGQLIRNPEITPFNIGTRIDISDFSREETQGYGKVLDTQDRSGERLMARVHHWLNGHPYLTQLLCSHIAADPKIRTKHDVDRLVRRLFLTPEARQREPNFADVERRMLDPDVPGLSPAEKRSQVLELYGRILRGKQVDAAEENPVVATLRLSGVGLEDRRALRLRNRLYGLVFDERWRRTSLPDAEFRRQRGAARVALLRATAVMGVMVLAVVTVAVNTGRLSNERQRALVELGKRSQDLANLSEERERALVALEAKNQELRQTSGERQSALGRLQLRTADLKAVSDSREKVLGELRVRSAELERKNYTGTMASIQIAIEQGRWARVADLIEASKHDRLRGWEWGHVAQMVGGQVAEAKLLPMRNEFEWDPDGSLSAVTKDAIYRVSESGLRLRRKFKGRAILPFYRKGDYRIGVDPATYRYVIRTADSDKTVVETGDDVESFDPTAKTLDVWMVGGRRERRSFEGKVLETLPPLDGDRASITRLGSGDEIALSRQGVLTRRSSNGTVLAQTSLNTGPLSAKQVVYVSRNEDLCMHIDEGVARGKQVRSARDLRVLATLEGPPSPGGVAAFSPDNRSVLIGNEGTISRFDATTGKLLSTYYGQRSPILRLRFLPDGRHFASMGRSGEFRVWTLDRTPVVRSLGRPAEAPADLLFSEDGKALLYPTVTGSFVSMNLATGAVSRLEKPTVNFSQANLRIVVGNKVYSGDHAGSLSMHSAHGLGLERSVRALDGPITGIVPLMGGKRLLVMTDTVIGHTAARYAIVEAGSLAVLHRFKPDWPAGGVNFAGYEWCATSDGELFAFVVNPVGAERPALVRGEGLILLMSAKTGKVVRKLRFNADINSAVLTPDGSKLVVSIYVSLQDASGKVVVLDAATGKEVETLDSPSHNIAMYLWADGQRLLSPMADGSLGLWDLAGDRKYRSIAPGKSLTFYCFSPNQDRVLTTLSDGTAMLWDGETGEERFSWNPAPAGGAKPGGPPITPYAEFTPDGTKIVMFCSDGVLRLFDSKNWG